MDSRVIELLDCVDSSRTRTVALSDFANKTMTESILGQLESRTSHPVAIAPGTDVVTKRTDPITRSLSLPALAS